MRRTSLFRGGFARLGLALGATALLAACGDRKLSLPTSDADIEAAALRGDSMARQIAVGQAVADSLSRIASGELDLSLLATLGEPVGELSRDSLPPAAGARSREATGVSVNGRSRSDSLSHDAAAGWEQRRSASASRSGADTLRGVLQFEGAPPAVRITLASPMARLPVALTGMAVSDLMRLEGLEVVVRGVRVSPRDLAVSSFAVRAVDDIPAVDGILVNEGGVWSVQSHDGERRVLSAVPASLQSFAGARVWVATAPGASPAFGVITRR